MGGMRCRHSALLGLAFSAVACATLSVPESQLQVLRAQASKDFSCPEAQLQDQRVFRGAGQGVDTVTGCGRGNTYFYDEGKGWKSALDRAEFDLSCSRSDLVTQSLGEVTVGVSGCGKKVVYIFRSGNFIMNSTSDSSPSAGPAANK